ncbi:unnamed protein product, partial [Microthlaspi erraticum]
YESNPVAWPSREGVGEVFSEFMGKPWMERTKRMKNQESYTRERIDKEGEQLEKLRNENREFAIREIMVDCLKGKMMMENYEYNPSVVQDLRSHIDSYLSELTCRIKNLSENDQSYSLPPFSLVAVADTVNQQEPVQYQNLNQQHPVQYQNVNQQAPVQYQDPSKFNGRVQHQNQNLNQLHPVQYQSVNQQGPVQYQDPAKFFGHVQNQNLNQLHPVQNQNVNHQGPVQYQDPAKFYGYQNLNQLHPVQHQNVNQQGPVQYHGPAKFNGHIQYQNQKQLHPVQYQNVNQHPVQYQNVNQHAPFQYQDPAKFYDQNQQGVYGTNSNQSKIQQPLMGHASIPSMDENPYRYYQLSTADLASTSRMPSTTTASTSRMPSNTTATAEHFAPDINDWFE